MYVRFCRCSICPPRYYSARQGLSCRRPALAVLRSLTVIHRQEKMTTTNARGAGLEQFSIFRDERLGDLGLRAVSLPATLSNLVDLESSSDAIRAIRTLCFLCPYVVLCAVYGTSIACTIRWLMRSTLFGTCTPKNLRLVMAHLDAVPAPRFGSVHDLDARFVPLYPPCLRGIIYSDRRARGYYRLHTPRTPAPRGSATRVEF